MPAFSSILLSISTSVMPEMEARASATAGGLARSRKADEGDVLSPVQPLLPQRPAHPRRRRAPVSEQLESGKGLAEEPLPSVYQRASGPGRILDERRRPPVVGIHHGKIAPQSGRLDETVPGRDGRDEEARPDECLLSPIESHGLAAKARGRNFSFL